MKYPLILMAALLSGSAMANQPGQCGAGFDKWDLNCDGKINYEEGVASQQAYRDEVAKVHQPAHREGLPPPSQAGYPDSAISPVDWADMPAGTRCGEYVMSQNQQRALTRCQGHNPRYSCPSGFSRKDFGYFEAGNGSRMYMWCSKN